MMCFIEEGLNRVKGEETRKAVTEKIPIGRYGEAIGIANLVLITVYTNSGFTSGNQYRIDDIMAVK
ncbi:hypothetical protein ACO1PF_07170 [Alkalibacterium sp. f15]|uniref:hypothetical protein n=1 Tax=Alkalibacterium sp. f15 TaxID=3414029 RepID=UPI003BF88EAE